MSRLCEQFSRALRAKVGLQPSPLPAACQERKWQLSKGPDKGELDSTRGSRVRMQEQWEGPDSVQAEQGRKGSRHVHLLFAISGSRRKEKHFRLCCDHGVHTAIQTAKEQSRASVHA